MDADFSQTTLRIFSEYCVSMFVPRQRERQADTGRVSSRSTSTSNTEELEKWVLIISSKPQNFKAYKPHLMAEMKKMRSKWAEQLKNGTVDNWKTVCFPDENY